MSFKIRQLVRFPKTPTSLRARVVNIPTRDPVNRQTAMLLRKAAWLDQPPVEIPETNESLRAKIKTLESEREARRLEISNLHADYKSTLKRLEESKAEKATLATKLASLLASIQRLEQTIDSNIRRK